MTETADAAPAEGDGQKKLFWACFVALTATSFAFILRIMILDDLADDFNLSETEQGEIKGVGIWPFAVSIVLFSLVIDKIGYGKAFLFAFVFHTLFAVLTIFATGYWTLYLGSLCGGLAAGAIESAINPVVATIFSRQKTKWLNILHAGWPGGLMLAGVLAIALGPTGLIGEHFQGGVGWQVKIALIFLPVLTYGIMLSTCRFPVNERVAAGVSYDAMLKQVGFLGAGIAIVILLQEVGRTLGWSTGLIWTLTAVLTIGVALYVRSPGRPLFIILMLTMIPLAITELGTDNWIDPLMKPEMARLGLQSGWVLVYTASLMMVLRFCAGAIVHRLSPLGLLAISSLLAILGLVFLSKAAGLLILAAATLYALGKTFFWPTMLGVVSEQFPKGGALTLNLMGGIGMLAAGVIGTPLYGNIQDKEIDRELRREHLAVHERVMGNEKHSVFGAYRAVDKNLLEAAGADTKQTVKAVEETAKKNALATVAVFPGIMLLSYLGMILYFRSRGGYHPVELAAAGADDTDA